MSLPPPTPRRKRRRWPWIVTLGLVLLVFIGYATENGPDPAPAAAVPVAPVAILPPPEPAGEHVTVLRVIDGDTFELSDGRTVRVLGIDSCEMNSAAGDDAKQYAEVLLATTATLTAEPGADKDRNGRLLRYVTLPTGSDFGVQMVMFDHTGVYQGRHDASAEYVQRLYAADTEYAKNPPAGRSCTPRAIVAQPDSGSIVDAPDGGIHKPRTGNTGHPCLPGERDGDGDGFCGEGR